MTETNMAFMPLGHNTNFTVFSVIKSTDSISVGGKIIIFFRKRIVSIHTCNSKLEFMQTFLKNNVQIEIT